MYRALRTWRKGQTGVRWAGEGRENLVLAGMQPQGEDVKQASLTWSWLSEVVLLGHHLTKLRRPHT